jgi:hypothetical protein
MNRYIIVWMLITLSLGCFYVIDNPDKITGYFYFLITYLLDLRLYLNRIEKKIDNLNQ